LVSKLSALTVVGSVFAPAIRYVFIAFLRVHHLMSCKQVDERHYRVFVARGGIQHLAAGYTVDRKLLSLRYFPVSRLTFPPPYHSFLRMVGLSQLVAIVEWVHRCHAMTQLVAAALAGIAYAAELDAVAT